MTVTECPECGETVPDGNYCNECGADLHPEGQLPREGSLHFHNDSADAVACEPDWDDIERGTEAEEALRGFMYEVTVDVRLTEDYEVEVLAVNGNPVERMSRYLVDTRDPPVANGTVREMLDDADMAEIVEEVETGFIIEATPLAIQTLELDSIMTVEEVK